METLRTKKDVVSSLYGNSEYVMDQQEKKQIWWNIHIRNHVHFFLSSYLLHTQTCWLPLSLLSKDAGLWVQDLWGFIPSPAYIRRVSKPNCSFAHIFWCTFYNNSQQTFLPKEKSGHWTSIIMPNKIVLGDSSIGAGAEGVELRAGMLWRNTVKPCRRDSWGF